MIEILFIERSLIVLPNFTIIRFGIITKPDLTLPGISPGVSKYQFRFRIIQN
ncbi:MAG: hypothetical protein KDB79_02075 [Acidobacteria bacterium]|nr:hypothetical protein [Acidobacteriota bacterium]